MHYFLLPIVFCFFVDAAKDAGDSAGSTIQSTALSANSALMSTFTSLATSRLSFRIQCSDCNLGSLDQSLTNITNADCTQIKASDACNTNVAKKCKCDDQIAFGCISLCNSVVSQQDSLKRSLIINGVIGGATGTIQGFADALLADSEKKMNNAGGTSGANVFSTGLSDSYAANYKNASTAECEKQKTEAERQRCYCEANGWQYNTATQKCSDTITDTLNVDSILSTLQGAKNSEAVKSGTGSSTLKTLANSDSNINSDSNLGTDSSLNVNSNLLDSAFLNKNPDAGKYKKTNQNNRRSKPNLTNIAVLSKNRANGLAGFSNSIYENDYSSDKNKEIQTTEIDIFAMVTSKIQEKYKIQELGFISRTPSSKYRSKSLYKNKKRKRK